MNISINMAARKTFKALIGLIILILFSFIYFLVDLEENSLEEKIVTKIIDGDTVIVEGGENIRLLGIDCDERGKKCYDKAKNYIEEILLNQKILLKSDAEDKDRYGRSLRYIFLNATNSNTDPVNATIAVTIPNSGTLKISTPKMFKLSKLTPSSELAHVSPTHAVTSTQSASNTTKYSPSEFVVSEPSNIPAPVSQSTSTNTPSTGGVLVSPPE